MKKYVNNQRHLSFLTQDRSVYIAKCYTQATATVVRKIWGTNAAIVKHTNTVQCVGGCEDDDDDLRKRQIFIRKATYLFVSYTVWPTYLLRLSVYEMTNQWPEEVGQSKRDRLEWSSSWKRWSPKIISFAVSSFRSAVLLLKYFWNWPINDLSKWGSVSH